MIKLWNVQSIKCEKYKIHNMECAKYGMGKIWINQVIGIHKTNAMYIPTSQSIFKRSLTGLNLELSFF